MSEKVKRIVQKYGYNLTRLIDILREIQSTERMISEEAISIVAKELKTSQIDVKGVATFYHFFTKEHAGIWTIYLNNSVTSEMMGLKEVAVAFELEVGCEFGQTSKDLLIGLRYTACIGMCDQEPAALINGIPFVNLTPEKARSIVKAIRADQNLSELKFSDVQSNIKLKGDVFFKPYHQGEILLKALSMPQFDIINEVKESNLRGRGGAGFPTGVKWQLAQNAHGDTKYVICNADEGEPGTFKDRVLLTESAGPLFEAMAICAYAVGATKGILYLRMEYIYLLDHLNKQLNDLRENHLLGQNINGLKFDFDIEIRLGAGSYVCGEETALIESLEGKRGEPRIKPPYPLQVGFLGMPTLINNVETLIAAAEIIKGGSSWYKQFGSPQSQGTKLLSVSGDIQSPGIYEIQWGLTILEFQKMVGAKNARAIVVGGPSGTIIKASEGDRKIGSQDLPTAGAMVVIDSSRDLLSVVYNYMKFFTDESCGVCLPCRGGNSLLTDVIEKIIQGRGNKFDLQKILSWSKIIKTTSRCGLGQTSPHPILSTLESFFEDYESRVNMNPDDMIIPFDLGAAEESYNEIFKKI